MNESCFFSEMSEAVRKCERIIEMGRISALKFFQWFHVNLKQYHLKTIRKRKSRASVKWPHTETIRPILLSQIFQNGIYKGLINIPKIQDIYYNHPH